MRAQRSEQPDPAPRRRVSWLGWLALTLSVLIGAAFALRRRRPALPASPASTEPPRPTSAPGRHAAPAAGSEAPPSTEAPATPQSVPTEPPVLAGPTAPAGPSETGEIDGGADGAGLEALVRVSGLGRRSAEALVVAGIVSLRALAASEVPALGEALDAAGVKRSATLATWPQQARRLLDT